MNDSQPSGLKANLIRQTERHIDDLRKRRAELEPELERIDKEIEEGRETLQLLKTGSVQKKTTKRKQINRTYAFEVLSVMDSEFTTHEFAEALDISNNAAAMWARTFMDEGLLERKILGRGNQPSIWVKNDPAQE